MKNEGRESRCLLSQKTKFHLVKFIALEKKKTLIHAVFSVCIQEIKLFLNRFILPGDDIYTILAMRHMVSPGFCQLTFAKS